MGDRHSDAQPRIDSHLRMAEDAIQKKDWPAARVEVERALRLDPAQRRAYELLARIDAAQGGPAKPRAASRRVRGSAITPDVAAAAPPALPAETPASKGKVIAGVAPALVIAIFGLARIGDSSVGGGCTPVFILEQDSRSGDLTGGDCPSNRGGGGGRADLYAFSGTAGSTVTIAMTASFDTYLRLVGPNGDVVAENDDSEGTNSRIRASLPLSGNYRIEAMAYGDSRGGYQLSLSSEMAAGGGSSPPPSTSPAPRVPGCTTQALPVGGSVAGTLSAADCRTPLRSSNADLYTFSGLAGQSVVIRMTSSFDNYLYLVGPTGSTVAFSDDGEGSDARIQTTLPATGTYTVHATAYSGSGNYRLSVTGSGLAAPRASDSNDPCVVGTIAPGQTMQGQHTGGGCAAARHRGNRYAFFGSQGQFVTIALRAGFDTYLSLVGPSGSTIASNDDDGGSTDSRVRITLPTTGTYFIEASGYEADDRGPYTLSVQ